MVNSFSTEAKCVTTFVFQIDLISRDGPAHGIVLKLAQLSTLSTHIIMLCLKGKVLRLAKTVHKTLPEPLKHGI